MPDLEKAPVKEVKCPFCDQVIIHGGAALLAHLDVCPSAPKTGEMVGPRTPPTNEAKR